LCERYYDKLTYLIESQCRVYAENIFVIFATANTLAPNWHHNSGGADTDLSSLGYNMNFVTKIHQFIMVKIGKKLLNTAIFLKRKLRETLILFIFSNHE